MDAETKEHRRLKKKIKTIFARCGFKADSEVHLDIDDDGNDDRSFDACAIHKNTLFVVECKDVSKLRDIKKELAAWKSDIGTILKNKNKIHVMSDSDGNIKDESFKKIEEIKLAFAFTSKLEQTGIKGELERKGVIFWDHRAVKYFDKVSWTLNGWTKYEILREFGVFEETSNVHHEKAIRIEQAGSTMFLLGIHPGLLLKIGYVLRRTSTKPYAYQRIINKTRIEKIGQFLSGKTPLLPNIIIVAFDKDVENEVEFDEKRKKQLTFPIKYCSAWIIDGQHRVYGFSKTKYENWDPESEDEYKLPVVAFKSLDEPMQNKTFVNINYYQKKIDATLLCDLAASIRDMSSELTWPSLLVTELNKRDPCKDMVKISEFDAGRPTTLSSFGRYALLERLLGFNKDKGSYNGPLFKYAPFAPSKSFDNDDNQKAFERQLELLIRFFLAVRKNVSNADSSKDPWLNSNEFSLTKTTGINALLLVLNRILEIHPDAKLNFDSYLRPLAKMDFTKDRIAEAGGGWRGFTTLADAMMDDLDKQNKEGLVKH